MFIDVRAHNVINWDLCRSLSCTQFVYESNLPIVPAGIGLALTRVNDVNVNLTIVEGGEKKRNNLLIQFNNRPWMYGPRVTVENQKEWLVRRNKPT